ncbi:TSC22 domain family protein 2 [Osmerus mordax]|uniref:TSC22 domain family protein 2 n=1 Tax=Osmerus mordax TaxID=8014 RepID=UPI00350FBC7D
MSKMPAKKKSCFQITSVTQAQVAASTNTDDTESLDDPDESRTEDVSSEIFDVSRADLGVCERSSSEETLNNVGDAEAAAVMALQLSLSQEGPPPLATGPVNGGFSVKSSGAGHGITHVLGGNVPPPAASLPSIPTTATQQPPSVNAGPAANVAASVSQAPLAATTSTTTSYSSRFRVIKLDHGTGEPFRRGRWTCTEFYERDSDGSSMSRTVDSIKHAVTLDHNVDSGLGTTGGSVVVPTILPAQNQGSTSDSGYSIAHHGHLPEPQQQGYGLAPQIGSTASAFQPTGYSAVGSQPSQQAQVNAQPAAPQTLLPGGLNGMPPGTMLQKSPIMPPATQAQQLTYSAHPAGISTTQPDYRQQHFAQIQPQGSGIQTLLMAPLSMGPPVSQGPSPVMTPVGAGAQGLGLGAHAGEVPGTLLGGQAASGQGLLLQVGGGVASGLPGGALQQPVSQPQPSTTHTGVQNVPATVPSATNTPPGMPGVVPQAQVARGGASTVDPAAGLPQGEDGRRKSEALPQPSFTKPFIPESLHLATPTVNSLFGIAIPIDGDEDSTSGASVVAIDNKIEQAMDLVKSHLMYAVREEVEVLKEQIKELYERNSMLERENAVLKSLANSDQLTQLSTQLSPVGSTSPPQQQAGLPPTASTTTPLGHHQEGSQALGTPVQPNVTSA